MSSYTFTQNYGTISSITNNISTLNKAYSIVLSNSTVSTMDFLFEVAPINISSPQISTVLGTTGVWFISYNTQLTPPTEDEINRAMDGEGLIKLSMKGTLVDNYGLIHNLLYNPASNQYNIKINPIIEYTSLLSTLKPLSNILIDTVKENVSDYTYMMALNNIERSIFNNLLNDNKVLKETVQNYEIRLSALERQMSEYNPQ
jgi:hypothetical protein